MIKMRSFFLCWFMMFFAACNTGNLAAQSGGAQHTEASMEVKITVGMHVISAVLYDNAAAKKLWDMMPLTLNMENLYGREMCYRMGAGSLPTAQAKNAGYRIGDISYWPPRGSLVILYKQNGEMFEQQPIGHTDDDIAFLSELGTTKVTFERIE